MAKHIYIAKQAKGLKFRVTVGDKDVAIKFENGQFSTEDDKVAAAIDEAFTASSIGRFCQKADRAAALALAAQHQAMLKRTGAHKGGVTAGAAKDAMNTEMQRRDTELRDAGGDSIKEQFDTKENLVLTEQGATEVSAGLGDQLDGIAVGEPTPDAEPAVDEGALATEVVNLKPKLGLKLG